MTHSLFCNIFVHYQSFFFLYLFGETHLCLLHSSHSLLLYQQIFHPRKIKALLWLCSVKYYYGFVFCYLLNGVRFTAHRELFKLFTFTLTSLLQAN
jgi:hypothetical protein